MEKMTHAKALTIAIETVEDIEVKAKLEALRERITKKSDGERKPTKTQRENAELKGVILEFMADGEKRTITELFKALESDKITSPQKVSALIRQLKDDGKVVREEVKGKAYFSIA